MLVKRIKYTDYNGSTREEDFYFNLNKGEIFNMQFGTENTTIGIDVDIEVDKSAAELSDSEIQAIEDCGAEFGGKNFSV